MDPISSQAIPAPITLPAPPAHAFGLPKESFTNTPDGSPEMEQNGASRPLIGSAFYTSPDGKQGRRKRAFDEGPAAAAKSRRVGSAVSGQAASQGQPLPGGSSALSSAGQALIRSKAVEAEAAQAEQQRLSSSIKDAVAGVQQASRNVQHA